MTFIFCLYISDDYNFAQPSMVPAKYETHGGEDVGIWAQGPMAHLFHRQALTVYHLYNDVVSYILKIICIQINHGT